MVCKIQSFIWQERYGFKASWLHWTNVSAFYIAPYYYTGCKTLYIKQQQIIYKCLKNLVPRDYDHISSFDFMMNDACWCSKLFYTWPGCWWWTILSFICVKYLLVINEIWPSCNHISAQALNIQSRHENCALDFLMLNLGPWLVFD